MYTPINVNVYIAAYTGALGGMAVGGGWLNDPVPANYNNVCIVAGSYAEAIDITWNDPTPLSGLEYDKIQCVTEQLFVGRGAQPAGDPTFQARANWLTVSIAVRALVRQADDYLVAQGINPSDDNTIRRARGVVLAALPTDLTQFVLAASVNNDGITYALGDTLLAIGEGHVGRTRSGPWLITAVQGGKGTLTRPSWWAHGATLRTSEVPIEVGSEGTIFANTRFRAMGPQTIHMVTAPGNSFVVGTIDPGMYPETLTTLIQLNKGIATIRAPILSISTGIAIIDKSFDRPATTAYYQADYTLGDWGSGANVTLHAMTDTGDFDEDNENFVLVTLSNQSFTVSHP